MSKLDKLKKILILEEYNKKMEKSIFKNAIIWLQIWYIAKFEFKARVNVDVVYAQAVHETAEFTSDIYKYNHNLFGMKKAMFRQNTALGEARGHAFYSSDYQSIRDYFLRQKDYNLLGISSDFVYMQRTCESGYAEDYRYREKWIKILNKIA